MTHAMQPRHWSKWVTISPDSSRGAVQRLVDQHDPSARRVGFLGPQHVRRAGVQAEPAVDAVLDDRLVRRAVQVERGHAQIPPTNTPGLHVPAGSKRGFTRRISSSAGPSVGAPRVKRVPERLRNVEQHRDRARRERLAQSGETASGVDLDVARAQRRSPDQRAAGFVDGARARHPARCGRAATFSMRLIARALPGALACPQRLRRPRRDPRARDRRRASSRRRARRGARPRRRRREQADRRARRAMPRRARRVRAARPRAHAPPPTAPRDRRLRRARVAVIARSGCNRTHTDRISPSVPNEPVNSFPRS